MTLDITKFISNSIIKQCKIQHCTIKTKTVKTDSIPKAVSKKIAKEYGETYLLDANYVSFFWGAIDKEMVKKLFNVVDKALGQSANKLTDTDFKKFSIDASLNEDDDNETDDSEDNDEIEDVEVEEIEDDAEDEIDDDSEKDKKTAATSYFFLKITVK